MNRRHALTVIVFAVGYASTARAQAPGAHSPEAGPPRPSDRTVDATIATRLKTVMVPLIQHMNRPIPLDQVQIGLMDDPHINAANAGGGHFYVTKGLLEKA